MQPVFTVRFDMRAPEIGAPAAELYPTAVDMCAWAQSRGAIAAVLSEHHGTTDGHLPAPITLAAAIAARADQLPIMVAAVVLPLWDPVRLAEEMAVADLISGGRIAYALGIGHRTEEYNHFGVDARTRGRVADEYLPLLLALLRGETVTHRGRAVTVTPRCTTPGGPTIMIAGGSAAAARRAGRYGLGMICQTSSPELRDRYEQECRANGHQPGFVQFPDPTRPTTVFVADDVDAAWAELGPHLLHDAQMAASYRHGDHTVASITRADTVAALRAEHGAYRVLSMPEAVAYIRAGVPLPLLPLCGGLPPETAWLYLERAAIATERAAEHP